MIKDYHDQVPIDGAWIDMAFAPYLFDFVIVLDGVSAEFCCML